MDYGKLDARLASAVEEAARAPESRSLVVILRLTGTPSDREVARLREAGVEAPPSAATVLTGVLSPRDVDELSEEPFVMSLSLSGRRRPMSDG